MDRNSKINFQQIKILEEYKDLLDAFSNWKEYIEETICTIYGDLKEFPSHKDKAQYRVVQEKIGYKDQDKLSFTLHYGFQTVFAYLKAFQDKVILTFPPVEKQLYFPVHCGSISYAEIPKLYKHILGVTGTLQCLTIQQKNILQKEYQICKSTFMPSVYGKHQLHFIEGNDIRIEDINSYTGALLREIEQRRKGRSCVRPILVFFENASLLMKFYQTTNISKKFASVRLMTEEVTPEQKLSVIRNATAPGAITLLTKEFGRGTDFIITDPMVEAEGGLHVIQTFFSLDPSEEIQIKGRAARQGVTGSYSMVLLDLGEASLEQFKIFEEDIGEMRRTGHYFDILHRQRDIIFRETWGGNELNLEQILKDHRETMNFFLMLKNIYSHTVTGNNNSTSRSITQSKWNAKPASIGKTYFDDSAFSVVNCANFGDIKEFILKQNLSPYPVEATNSRTVVLMDATGSMYAMIENTKAAIKIMFERAYDIIESNQTGAIFEVQFACYRNYSSGEYEILQASPWSTRPEPLCNFINTIHSSGGQGNEAIEIGFWHVNNEMRQRPDLPRISEVILVGDYPPNTEEEVIEKRGSKHWVKYSEPTHYLKELDEMIEQGVKVYSFYVDEPARNAFTDISQRSGGTSTFLQVSDEKKAAKALIDVVTTTILNDVGGAAHGPRLVAAYKQKYGYAL